MKQNELPLGFGMALAQHPDAMQRFATLPENQKAIILQRAHSVSSRDEMQSIIHDLIAAP